jgi:hypothetical protein
MAGKKMSKIYSLNDYIYFRITDVGMDALDKQSEEFHREYPCIDIQYKPEPYKGDWYKERLRWILEHFGDQRFCRTLLPIIDLTFDDPTNEDGAEETKEGN